MDELLDKLEAIMHLAERDIRQSDLDEIKRLAKECYDKVKKISE